jgi:hypothetical protein
MTDERPDRPSMRAILMRHADFWKRLLRVALFSFPLLFLLVFFFYPLANIIGESLTVGALSNMLKRS